MEYPNPSSLANEKYEDTSFDIILRWSSQENMTSLCDSDCPPLNQVVAKFMVKELFANATFCL